MSMKAYVGYDLGDGETVTELEVLAENSGSTLSSGLCMPERNNEGEAIPTTIGSDNQGGTVFANYISYDPNGISDISLNFKRRPTDLLDSQPDSVRVRELINMLESGKIKFLGDDKTGRGKCPELYTDKMLEFARKAVDFTNAIFGSDKHRESLNGKIKGCEDITFCVGYPTKWNDLDRAIYYEILSESILGSGKYDASADGAPSFISSSIILAKESRAAFLKMKNDAQVTGGNIKGLNIPEGSYVLLIDAGSSTIDITAMTTSAKNVGYNSGSNYLGARVIDYIVRDMYLQYLRDLREKPDNIEMYNELAEKNPDISSALTLVCRLAKEELFSSSRGRARIYFCNLDQMELDSNALLNALKTVPIGGLLKHYFSVPDDEADMLNMSWADCLEKFLNDTKSDMKSNGIEKVGGIILTGGASKMPIVREIVKKVFDGVNGANILNDSNGSRTISQGLALVGPYDEKARLFQKEAEDFCSFRVPQIIGSGLTEFVEKLSNIMESVIRGILMYEIGRWKKGAVDTLDDVTKNVKRKCEADNLERYLKQNEDYVKLCNERSAYLGKNISEELGKLCEKYGTNNAEVNNIKALLDDMLGNIFSGFSINPFDALVSTISVIVAGLVLALVTIVTAGVINIAIAIAAAFANRLRQLIKGKIEDFVQYHSLPLWLRKCVSEDKIIAEFNKCNLAGKIKEDLLTEENMKKMVNSTLEEIRPAVMKCADDIRYLIQ